MATMRTKHEKPNGHSYDYAEVDMVPTEFRNGQATRYEIIHADDEPTYAPAVYDDAPIVAPVQPDRLPRVQRIVQTNAIEEARGFNIRVSSLAVSLGGGAVLLAALFGASLSAWAGIMIFGVTFAATWAAAFALDAMTSAGGVELFHAFRMWAFLDREQAHRHQRYSVPKTDNQRLLETVLLAAAVGVTALAAVGMVAAVFMENAPR